MPIFYLESSALFKRYRTEIGTSVVSILLDGVTDADELVTSHLTSIEIEAALARAVKGRALDERAHDGILRAFADDLGRMFVVPISLDLVNEAARVARQYALRALDAIHFATVLGVAAVDRTALVLVASDRELVEASRSADLGGHPLV